MLLSIAMLSTSACLEPNPYAEQGEGSESLAQTDSAMNDTQSESDSDADTDSPPCDPCGLAFETLSFTADEDGFVGEVPKPDQPNTAPIALIRRYDPDGGNKLGYRINWTERDEAWEIEVELLDPDNDAQLRGLAVVLGTQAELDSEVLEIDSGECAQPSVSGAVVVESVEHYDPDGGDVLDFSRSDPLEYCASAEEGGARIDVRVLAFSPGEGPLVLPGEAQLNTGASQVLGFEQVPEGAAVLHLISARDFNESSATDLGYDVDCDDGAVPYPCEFDLLSFKGGAEAAFGGVTIAIP